MRSEKSEGKQARELAVPDPALTARASGSGLTPTPYAVTARNLAHFWGLIFSPAFTNFRAENPVFVVSKRPVRRGSRLAASYPFAFPKLVPAFDPRQIKMTV